MWVLRRVSGPVTRGRRPRRGPRQGGAACWTRSRSRLLAALALGAAIGVEREASSQPAGLRTHVSVAIGACLFGIISTLGFLEYQAVRETTNVQIDVTRVRRTWWSASASSAPA